MKKGEKNLLVCTGFLGLAVSESNIHYRLTNDQIVKMLGTKGIKALPAKKYNSEDNAALDWNLGDFLGQKRLALQDNLLYQKADGNYAVRFTQYTYVVPEKSEDDEFSNIDREENQDNHSNRNQLYVITEEKTISQNKIYNIDEIDLENFTLSDMNKILDIRYYEYIARGDTHDEAVSFSDQEFHTGYVDDILEDKTHPSKIF